MYDPLGQNDDLYPPMPPSSPTSMTTENDDSVSTLQEKQRAQFRSLQRRPGLGVVQDEIAPKDEDGPPSPAEAKERLGWDDRKLEADLVAGETVMFLAIDSYHALLDWLEKEDEDAVFKIGQIDNKDLFEYYESFQRPGRMRVGLKSHYDFVFVTPKTWDLLMDWFGGGPGISRKCVNENGRAVVDIRGIELKVKRSSKPTKFMRHVMSLYDTVGTLKRAAIEDWKALSDDFISGSFRIWDYHNDKCTGRMHPESSQLNSFRLIDGQAIMFEESDPITGEFRWDPITGEDTSGPVAYNNGYSTGGYSSNLYDTRRKRAENAVVSLRRPVIRGAVGLTNLGNTCFMNSTLQCLSNVWLLRDKFVSGEYQKDINDKNVLGTGGKLANSFGDLMRLVWGDEGDLVTPIGFKTVMAEFKPEFSGYHQHDSQELLSFLLDGLHEDLNRVKTKPPTDPVEANGRPDADVAADSCRVHRMRNNSFVNDLFEGFYKSTVVCPDCHKVSVTFDPFTMVQLPVSRPRQAKTISFPVAVLDAQTGLPSRARPYLVRVAQEAFMHEVKVKACTNDRPGLSPNDTILCSLYRERVDKIYTDFDKPDRLSTPDELIAFEDPNAGKIRLVNELASNGTWYRPLGSCGPKAVDDESSDDDFVKDFEDIKPSPPKEESGASSVDLPFTVGDVWIGSFESRKYRIRMQVKQVLTPGPWAQGLGHRIQCILDVGPNTNFPSYYYERKDGSEEVAYVIWGFMSLSHPSQQKPTTFSCVFEQLMYLGSYGSYNGDNPMLTPDKQPFTLEGSIDSYGFFAGTIEEQDRPGYRTNSFYSYPKPFSMIKIDQSIVSSPDFFDPRTQKQGHDDIYGPQPAPSANQLALIVLQHRRAIGGGMGQPALFSMPCTCTPKQLYSTVLARMTARAMARLGTPPTMEDNDMSVDATDPFALRGSFNLLVRVPGEQPRLLVDDDDETLLAVSDHAVPKLDIIAEWDPSRAPEEQSRLGEAIFGNLYVEDGMDDDSKRLTKLYDCFDMFSEEEKLSSTETWYCSNCKAHKEAFKRMEIWQLPDVLIIHLKRFSQSQSSYYVDKDDTEIDFPLEGLDLRDRVRSTVNKDDCIYDLVAVSHHYGGLGGGHYVAHARNEANGSWYEFDDGSVRLLGETSAMAASRVKGGSAYVLMYMRRSHTGQKWSEDALKTKALLDPSVDSTDSSGANGHATPHSSDNVYDDGVV